MMYLKNEKGITLLEVLISIVILTIILATVINFFPQMALSNINNVDRNQAINLAKGELIHWQNKITTNESLEQFKHHANKRECSIDEENDCYFYHTDINNEEYKGKFDVEVEVWEVSDLEPDLSNSNEYWVSAHKIYVQIIEDDNNNKIISETYGYLLIE